MTRLWLRRLQLEGGGLMPAQRITIAKAAEMLGLTVGQVKVLAQQFVFNSLRIDAKGYSFVESEIREYAARTGRAAPAPKDAA